MSEEKEKAAGDGLDESGNPRIPPSEAGAVIELDAGAKIARLGERVERLETRATQDEQVLGDFLKAQTFSRIVQGVVLALVFAVLAIVLTGVALLLFNANFGSLLPPAAVIVLISGSFVSVISISGFALLGVFPRRHETNDKKMSEKLQKVIPASELIKDVMGEV